MIKNLFNEKRFFAVVCAALVVSASCSFSVRPVYNSEKKTAPETTATPAEIRNRDDLKAKGIEQVNTLHRLMESGRLEEAYQMIDDGSSLKLPKSEALESLRGVVDTLGRLEKMNLTRDSVVEDKSLKGGQLQVRQEFIVMFEKDTPTPKRYELFIWNIYADDTFKLWAYINSKGDD